MTDLGRADLRGVIDDADLETLRDSVAEVLAQECDSIALHRFIDGDRSLEQALLGHAAELGWFALSLPEPASGLGLGPVGIRLLATELGRACAPGAFTASIVAGEVLSRHGDPALPDDILARLIGAECPVAIACEWDGGADTSRTLLLGAADAGLALLPHGDSGAAIHDISLASKKVRPAWDLTRELFEADVSGEPLCVLGEGSGDLVRQVFAIALAADSVGLSRGILDRTMAYMVERVQFDRPVASFQALKHRIVDFLTRTVLAEQSLAHAVETALNSDPAAPMWAALAKASACEAASDVAGGCIQLFGGVGFTWEYDPHIYAKRARLNQMLLSSSTRLLDQAAEDLAGHFGAKRSVLELEMA